MNKYAVYTTDGRIFNVTAKNEYGAKMMVMRQTLGRATIEAVRVKNF